MKKTILALSLITGFITANAQKSHVEFGIKGGLNVATLSSDNNTNFKSRLGFHVGGLAHIHVSKYFAVQPEVMYSSQGAKYTTNTDFNYNINYVNIPLLVQFMAGQGFRVETGPQLGILTSARTETGNVSVITKSSYNSTDFSWAVGVGYLSSSNVGIDVRYNLGISDITKSSNVKTVNNVLQLGLFYQFR